jgi:hypothetical protein
MIYALVAVSTAFLLSLGAAVHAHRALYLLKCAQAEMVATALGNSVLVDGIELPKPDDARWTYARAEDANKKKLHLLHIGGAVRVSEEGAVYICGKADDIALGVDITPATKKYCATVWKEYRSRVARKAIETST